MDMSGFWGQVSDDEKLTSKQVKNLKPKGWMGLKSQSEDWDLSETEFAWTVYPNMGPAGCYFDEDEETFPEDADWSDDEISRSLSGKKALMGYRKDVDELWILEGSEWILWNY